MSAEENPALIKRFQEGDESALEELIAEFSDGLFGFIYRYLGDRHEAADVLSETFTKAYRNRRTYRPRAKFQTWLFTIAGNLCRDHLRKRKRRPGDFAVSVATEEVDPTISQGEPPDEGAIRSDDLALLRQAIAALPHGLRTVVILVALEGDSHQQAAEKLGCTARAVEARLRRAREAIRVEMTCLQRATEP